MKKTIDPIVSLPHRQFIKSHSQEEFLSPKDRILILAPHPDDEIIATGGLIQRALKKKLPIQIVYLTYGDSNELSFLFYKKHPIISSKGFLNMGEARRKESIQAIKHLGLKEEHLVFLGYPDFWTQEIFTKHWSDVKPFKNMFTKRRFVPYRSALSFQAPYNGESIIADLKKVLLKFRPTKTLVTLPNDVNRDHRSFYLFLQVALWDLKPLKIKPQVIAYLVHAVKWPKPQGHYPDLPLDPPRPLVSPQMTWHKFNLTADEVSKKREAIGYFKSQRAYNPRFLYSFARSNELFGKLKDILLNPTQGPVDWNALEHSQETRSHLADPRKKSKTIIRSVAYALKDGSLHVQLKTNRWKSKLTSMNFFLLGYAANKNFTSMPKLKINFRFDRFWKVWDHQTPVVIKDLKCEFQGEKIFISVPLKSLNNPDYIFSTVSTNILYISLEVTAWRTLVLNKEEGKDHGQR